MLTGYNTDIRRGELVVHVQTEDKGKDNPCVESLIYLGGRVVASKRSSYADLLANGDDEAAISKLMDRQHRTIVAAIQRGRLDDKLQSASSGEGFPDGGSDDDTPSGIHAVVNDFDPDFTTSTEPIEPPEASESTELLGSIEPAIAAEPPEAPDEERPAVSAGVLSLDLSSATPLAVGDTVVVWVRAFRAGDSAPGVEIRVEMISTVQAPVLLAEGATDPEGLFKTDLELPDLDSGSAAIIISGAEGGDLTEVKQLL